jgi:hypothetical protein
MKKLLLLALVSSFGLSLVAQKISPKISDKLAKQTTVTKNITTNDQQVIPTDQTLPLKAAPLTISNTQLGTTEYDLQSNKCVQNRVVKHPDGTISAAWTMGTGTFTDRGTGYNYYDGTAWQAIPTARIEPLKTGWPSMTVANGNEVVICHNSSTSLTMSTRTKGTGAWTTTSIPFSLTNGLMWPRAMGKGLSFGTIHLIACKYVGSVAGGMLYSRSLDGGATWDIQDMVLPGVNPVTEMLPPGGDSYTMDVKGDTVGIVVGDMTSDVVLIKSFDGGTTWAKQIVWQHQIPLWRTDTMSASASSDANGDLAPDSLTTTDGRYALTIDNDGVFHVFMGIIKILRDSTTEANYFSSFPYTDGIVYWNSTQPTIVPAINFYADTALNKVGYMVDVNGDDSIAFNTVDAGSYPWGAYSFTSLSSFPSAAVGADGSVYCTYSSLVEGTDNGLGLGYRNIYAIKSADQGTTWSDPVNITKDDFLECTFGSLNRNVDSDLYMSYQNSGDPGLWLTDPTSANPHQEQLTNISFVKISNDLVIDTDVKDFSENNISVSQNYPNPFSNTSNVVVNLTSASDLSLNVINLIGQKVVEINNGTVCAGSHTLTIDGSNLKSGIYFYTVKAGATTVTHKMIVE